MLLLCKRTRNLDCLRQAIWCAKSYATIPSNPYGRLSNSAYGKNLCCRLLNGVGHTGRSYSSAMCLKSNSVYSKFNKLLQQQNFIKCYQVKNNYVKQSLQCFRKYASQQSSKPAEKLANNGEKLPLPNMPKRSDVSRLFALARPEKRKVAAAICFLLVSSGVTMAVPFCLGKVIDIINTANEDGTLEEKLKYLCKILFVVFVVGGFANFGRVYFIQIAGQNIVKRLRENVFSSIMKQEVGFFDKTKTGELINRLSSDTALVGQAVTMNISDGLRSTAQAIGGVGMMVGIRHCPVTMNISDGVQSMAQAIRMMVYVSPKLAVVALCIVPPVVLGSIFYGRYVKKITKRVQDSLANATQVSEERVSNIRTVRAFAQEARECDAYDKKITEVLLLTYKEALARGIFWGFTGLSGNLIILSVFYSGGMMMNEAQITIGDLSAFMMYAAYVGMAIGGLSSFYTELMRGVGASSRLWSLVDRVPAIPITDGLIPTSPVQGDIQFKGVSFHYPARPDVTIFSDLNLSVPAGAVTAVVGASGSGKSTLGSLLLRFYSPENGSVYLDGENITDLNPSWLRNQIGTVSQEPILFSCSVAENIAYGAGDVGAVTMDDIMEAARKANAYHFVKGFPNGFDTLVGERGLMLSGGQRQRIAIARAIIKNPKILLLDEATSALDSHSEYLVHEALERLMVGRTVITIAHRLSTIKSADQIAVLDEGQVKELGTYSQLMAIPDGIFHKLVERQTITT